MSSTTPHWLAPTWGEHVTTDSILGTFQQGSTRLLPRVEVK